MPPVGFEPTNSAGERPQTDALDRAATGTGVLQLIIILNDDHATFVTTAVNITYFRALRDEVRLP